MLKRLLLTALSIIALLAGIGLGAIQPAAADTTEYCDPVSGECFTVITSPPSDPISSPDPETGFSPGAAVCGFTTPEGSLQVDCTTGGGNYWSNARQCYVSLADPQNAAPPGSDPAGAWYRCTPHPICSTFRDCYDVSFWSNTPPPGITRLSPGQAAAILIRSFQLQPINIGFAPDPNTPGSKSYVGVPIWMWAANPQPLEYGPYSQTATLGGVTITATAQVTSILWNMGDGNTVACGNPGTPFRVEYGAVESPTCGHRYTRTSDDQPGGRYTVTATSQWQVTWTGGGQTGSVPLTRQATTTVDINEIQSINVDPEK